MKNLPLKIILALPIIGIAGVFGVAEVKNIQHGPPSDCVMRGALPDSLCTPGETTPAVTLKTLKMTICKAGWAKTQRPPTGYTNPLKTRIMAEYGTSINPTLVELDHLINISLGGHPTSTLNLWPQPRDVFIDGERLGYKEKDVLEVKLKNLVCAGGLPLEDAQRMIRTDWAAAYKKYVENEE